jgi:hypothetical protein
MRRVVSLGEAVEQFAFRHGGYGDLLRQERSQPIAPDDVADDVGVEQI